MKYVNKCIPTGSANCLKQKQNKKAVIKVDSGVSIWEGKENRIQIRINKHLKKKNTTVKGCCDTEII